jgi:cell division septum initiation protein DivIVA
LARFERQEASEDRLANTLGAATEQLRAALEREAVEIINKAREEASGIEEDALRRADEIERDARATADEARVRADEATARAETATAQADEADARAREAQEAQSARIAALMRDVEGLEQRMLDAVRDLRSRLLSETAEVEAPPADRDEHPAAEPAPPDVNGAGPDLAAEEHAAPSAPPEPDTERAAPFSGPLPLNVATEVDAATERNPVLDQMMRAQLTSFAENGTARAEAERFLSRFKLGESYIGMLDEIYSRYEQERTPGGGQGKRRRFRRRGT